jgi:hypothetical protein
MNDPRSKHDINLDNFSLFKEVRRPDHLDALESYYILKAKKEGKVLLNNDERKFNFASQPGPCFILHRRSVQKFGRSFFVSLFQKEIRDKLNRTFLNSFFFSHSHMLALSKNVSLAKN